MYQYLGLLSFLQSIIGFILTSSAFMRFKKPVKRRLTLGFFVMIFEVLILVLSIVYLGVPLVERFVPFVIFGITLSWYLIVCADKFFVASFTFLTSINIYVFISYISDTLAVFSYDDSFIVKKIIYRTIIYLILLPILYKIVRPRFRILVSTIDREWKAANLIPSVFLFIQIIILYYPKPYWRWSSNSWLEIIILSFYVLFIVVYYILYVQSFAIIQRKELEAKQLLMSQQDKLWESEINRQKKMVDLASKQRHDMHHHNMVIIEMLKQDKLSDLNSYMEAFDNSLYKGNQELYCSHPIGNSIFNVFVNRAKESAIKTTIDASIPREILIDNVDLTNVLGNILENAIEGCQRLNDSAKKEINVLAKYDNNRLKIKVENTAVNNIEFENGLPISQKLEGGIGSKSILNIVENYNGNLSFSNPDDKFIVQLILNENTK